MSGSGGAGPGAPVEALVVDDEAPARKRLRDLLAQVPDVELVGEAGDGSDAVEAIRELGPDLVFLDVQMPGMDGFEVLEAVGPRTVPAVVFVTAYDRHAVAAFEARAVDYLLKPFTAVRFRETLARVRETLRTDPAGLLTRMEALLRQRAAAPDRLPVPTDRGTRLLEPGEIRWIEADGNYAIVHAGPATYRMRATLTSLVERLESRGFVRIHHSYVVNTHRITELEPWSHGELAVVLDDGTSLVSTRTYTPGLRERLGL